MMVFFNGLKQIYLLPFKGLVALLFITGFFNFMVDFGNLIRNTTTFVMFLFVLYFLGIVMLVVKWVFRNWIQVERQVEKVVAHENN